jgi:ankyrin repeat protein
LRACAAPGAPQGGFTPLHLSARGGHVHMSALLIERGADINATAQARAQPRRVSRCCAARGMTLLC